jgi:REP-associated tyrosine transposase
MSRQARIDIPGLLQHVIVRGVDRTDIFLDDDDREDFVKRLSCLLAETKTYCLAWALLDNHVHLLLQPTEQPLARLMRRLLTGYAVVFNLRHNRSGHLFQNRYKSIVCDADNYLLELVRYIHLNPIRAGVVDTLEGLAGYRWCGHQQLLGKPAPRLIHEDGLLPLFSKRKKDAVNRYLHFLTAGLEQGSALNMSAGGRRASQTLDCSLQDDDRYDDRILGGGAFVDRVLTEARFAESGRLPLDKLIDMVAAFCNVAAEELPWPCRQAEIVRAKAIICFWATRRGRVPGVDLAKRLGYSTSAVSRAARRGQQLFENDAELQALFTGMDF